MQSENRHFEDPVERPSLVNIRSAEEVGQRIPYVGKEAGKTAHANQNTDRFRRIWLLAGVLILAIFFRSYHFTSMPPGLYADEAMDGNNAVEALQTGHFRVFYTEDNGREGLYVNIIALFLRIWPIYEPWVLRLPAAIAGVLTVYGLYFLVSQLFGYETGLLSAFLLATSFWHINFSRIGYRVILAPVFLTWSLYFLMKSLASDNSTQRFGGTRIPKWWRECFSSPHLLAGLAGIIYGLGFYTYIAYRITPILFLLFIPFFVKGAGFRRRLAVFLLCTFIVTMPIGYYFAKHPDDLFQRISQISITSSANPLGLFAINFGKTLLMFNVHGDDNWGHNIPGSPELFWPVGLLFVIGIAVGMCTLGMGKTRRTSLALHFSRFGLWLTFLWFLLAAIPPAATIPGIPSALRSLLMLPPAMIFAGIGGVWLYGAVRSYGAKRAARFLAAVFVVVVAGVGYYRYFVVWAPNPHVRVGFDAQYVEIGREINALPASTQKYVIVTAPGYLARGIPVPAQTTMFITDSFTQQGQAEHHIKYLLPNQIGAIPPGTPSNTIFYVR